MSRRLLTDKVRLEELYAKELELKRTEPIGSSPLLAHLSYQILLLEKKLKISNPDRQFDCIGIMIEHAYYMKMEQKDRHVAKKTFQQILRLDRYNPEANYRYAFLHYEEDDWIKAIQYFQAALLENDSNFPLSSDQVMKANLFISYCAMMIVKESIHTVNELKSDELMETEGISIEELSDNVKDLLSQSEYKIIRNEGESFISQTHYEELESIVESDAIWLDLTLDQPYIKSGNRSIEISRQNGLLLKRLLLKSAKQEGLALTEITGYQDEFLANSIDISWDNYRQKVRRINERLRTIGLPSPFIQHVTGKHSYRIEPCTFSIIEYDAK
ncbi:tetratricopeptide repeat protein [Sporosarcina sp. ITBMC105]